MALRHFGAISVSSVVLKGKYISSQSMMSKNWKYEFSFFPQFGKPGVKCRLQLKYKVDLLFHRLLLVPCS